MHDAGVWETALDGFKKKITRKVLLKTGIKFIDEATGGIMPNDCFMVGAGTGIGKTQISSQIALHIAESGHGVAMFILESYRGEMADKEKFQRIKQVLFERKNFKLLGRFQFRPWECGKFIGTEIEEIEKSLIAPEIYKNTEVLTKIKIRYRANESYNVFNFEKDIDTIVEKSDIKIMLVDHLHFFDLHLKEENQAIKNIVNRIRDKAQLHNIPSIIFSHIRKKVNQFDHSVVPSIDEFHGTSEITKNPTLVLAMAQAYNRTPSQGYYSPTFFKLHKDRFENSSKKFYALLNYNLNSGKYEHDYQLFKNTVEGMEEIEPGERPFWAKSVSWGGDEIANRRPKKVKKPKASKEEEKSEVQEKKSVKTETSGSDNMLPMWERKDGNKQNL